MCTFVYVCNPKGSTYLYQGYTKFSRTNSNTCRRVRKSLISIQTCTENRIVVWSGWRLPRQQKHPPLNEPSGPTTAGGFQAAELAFKHEHIWLLPWPRPHSPWIGEGSEVETVTGDHPQHQTISFSSSSAWLGWELQWIHIPMAFALDLPTDGAAAAQRKQLLILLLLEEKQSGRASRTSHTSGRRSYFAHWFDGEEDVWEKRLRPDGAVERDDAGQERPEHHQDVEVAAPWMKALP